jgi:peroxiredoxin
MIKRPIRRDRYAVIGINVGDTQRRVQVTATRLNIDCTVLLDNGSTVFKDWGASFLPTSYILDRDGRVRYLGLGPLEWDRGDIKKRGPAHLARTPL